MISSKIRHTVDKIVCLSTNQKTPNRTTFNIISSISIKLYDKTHRMIEKQNIVQYEIVANKRTGIVMYADAGDRNRTYQMTGQNSPTTPQRHTFRKAGISTIYKQKQIGHFRRNKNEGVKNAISKIQTWISTPIQFHGLIVRIERCVSRMCMTLRRHRGSNPGLPHGSSTRSHNATATYI